MDLWQFVLPCVQVPHNQEIVLQNVNIVLSDEVKKELEDNKSVSAGGPDYYTCWLHCNPKTGLLSPLKDVKLATEYPNALVTKHRGNGKNIYHIYFGESPTKLCIKNLIFTEMKLSLSGGYSKSLKSKIEKTKAKYGFKEAYKWNCEYYDIDPKGDYYTLMELRAL